VRFSRLPALEGGIGRIFERRLDKMSPSKDIFGPQGSLLFIGSLSYSGIDLK